MKKKKKACAAIASGETTLRRPCRERTTSVLLDTESCEKEKRTVKGTGLRSIPGKSLRLYLLKKVTED